MIKKFKFLIFSVVFVISVMLILFAGYFRKSITLESGRFKLDLSPSEGISKGKVAIYTNTNYFTTVDNCFFYWASLLCYYSQPNLKKDRFSWKP